MNMINHNIINHIAIIMDGNRTWARKNNISNKKAYLQSSSTISNTVDLLIKNNIPYLSLFAFSVENFNRNPKEILILKEIINEFTGKAAKKLIEQGVKLLVIGEYQKFGNNIVKKIDNIIEQSKNNTQLTLTIALNYSGKQDLLYAFNGILKSFQSINTSEISEDHIQSHLYTSNLPDPDILIRTGGNKRISNFFLWQLAYTELFFLDINWPDFTKIELNKTIDEFYKRERKYGE